MKSIQTLAIAAVIGMASVAGFAVGAPEVIAEEAEAKTIEYVAGMTGVT